PSGVVPGWLDHRRAEDPGDGDSPRSRADPPRALHRCPWLDRAGRGDGDVDPDPDPRRRRGAADAPRRRWDHLGERPARGVGRDRGEGERPARGDRRARDERRVTDDRVAPGGRPGVQSTPPMGSRPAHVWIDGRIVEATEPVLTPFDRGFQLGDGVFETLRARSGRPAELPEHAARLQRSAAGLSIPLPDDIERTLARAIEELLVTEGLGGPDG